MEGEGEGEKREGEEGICARASRTKLHQDNVDLIALMRTVLHYTAAEGFPRVLPRQGRKCSLTPRTGENGPGVNQISLAS